MFFKITLLLFTSCAAAANPPFAQTTYGPIEGFTLTTFTGKEISAFFGIPYAKPPIGNLRFIKPVPVEPWIEVFKANTLPPACPQEWVEPLWMQKEVPMSEDCLHMIISVPKTTYSNTKRIPVIVRFHGGGFTKGGISLHWSNTTAIVAEENVIVVNVQYRIGVFGFLYLGTGSAHGNVGLWDQNLALQWIKKNIESFGGDPDSITIAGESAGAASVNYHLLSPHSHPYFHRAIMDSGSALNPWAYVEPKEILNSAMKLAEALDCKSENMDKMFTCLQEVDAERLVAETSMSNELNFAPTLDGEFISKSPEELIKDGQMKNVNILAGLTSNEGLLVLPMMFPIPLEQISRTHFHNIVQIFTTGNDQMTSEVIKYFYTNWTNPDSSWNNVISIDGFLSDVIFNCKVNEMLDISARVSDATIYKYTFDFPQKSPLFPGHKFCLHAYQYLHWSGAFLNPVFGFGPEEKAVSLKLMRIFANFARTGDPNISPDGSSSLTTRWPKYSSEKKENFLIQESNERVEYGLRENECALWRELVPKLQIRNQHCDIPAR